MTVSDHCAAFATSMDTEGELVFNNDFDEKQPQQLGLLF